MTLTTEEALARANSDALEVILAAREATFRPYVEIGSRYEDPVRGDSKTDRPPFGFDRAWDCSPPKGDWSKSVWLAYETTFRVECGKANVGLIYVAAYNSSGNRWGEIHAVDITRWRCKAGRGTITPGIINGSEEPELQRSHLDDLFEPNKRSLKQRLFRR